MNKRKMKKELKKMSRVLKKYPNPSFNNLVYARRQGKTELYRAIIMLTVEHGRLYKKLSKNGDKWVNQIDEWIFLRK